MKRLRYLVFILVAISNILMTMGRIDFYKSDYIKNRFLHRDSQTYILRPKDHRRMSSDYPNELREYSAGLDIKRVGYSFDGGSQSANIDIYNIGEEGHSSKKEKVMGYNINTYGGDDILDLPPEGIYNVCVYSCKVYL